MATTHTTQIRTADDRLDAHGVLLAIAYAGGVLATVAAATAVAALLASFTSGLGAFVLVAAGWLVVVSASPEIGKRIALRLDRVDIASRAPRSSRAVTAAVTYLISR